MPEVTVAGCGPGAVELIARGVFQAAQESEVIIGPERLLRYFENTVKKILKGNYREILDWVVEHRNKRTILILVTGDPLIHSFGKMVVDRIGIVRIIPGISSVQYALAKVGRSWEGVKIISLHGKTCPDLTGQINNFPDLAILTDGEKTAQKVLQAARQVQGRCVYLCENLSLENESVRIMHPGEEIEISPLNLILILTDQLTPYEKMSVK